MRQRERDLAQRRLAAERRLVLPHDLRLELHRRRHRSIFVVLEKLTQFRHALCLPAFARRHPLAVESDERIGRRAVRRERGRFGQSGESVSGGQHGNEKRGGEETSGHTPA